ncbi:MAG: hypothetical protein PHR35_11540, partial [Kiritimatiellae bacterium]|nr:hypothetical protein [Kiritimatiellia bacterium]
MPLFQLERYVLDTVSVATNPTYDKKASDQSLRVETTVGTAQNNTDPSRYMLRLMVSVGPDKDKTNQPPAYLVTIAG